MRNEGTTGSMMTVGNVVGRNPNPRNRRLPIMGYGLLVSIASHQTEIAYGTVYDVLADRLGWRERWQGHGWANAVKTVCVETAKINKDNGEPILASLVRKQDGTIGDGYATAVEIRYDDTRLADDEIQAHADAEAQKCWAYFGRLT